MDATSEIINKYERYVTELKAAHAEQEKVIQLQQEMIEGLQELLIQKDETIELLTADLEKTMATATEMARMVDSFFQN